MIFVPVVAAAVHYDEQNDAVVGDSIADDGDAVAVVVVVVFGDCDCDIDIDVGRHKSLVDLKTKMCLEGGLHI